MTSGSVERWPSRSSTRTSCRTSPRASASRAEALSAAVLSHPGIVAVYDVEATEASAAIVFELVHGESLSDRLTRVGRLREVDAVAIAAQLADALDHAHRHGVVHRDVKPGNVLLAADGRARLVDFGIARSLDEAAAHLTQTGTIVGTLRYMAPEQLRGERVTPTSDLYALGAVLYEMLAGRPPYEARTPVAVVEELQHAPPPLTGVSHAVASITLAALRPDPSERPRSGAAMAQALRAWTSDIDTAVIPLAAASGMTAVDAAAQRPERGTRSIPRAAVAIAGGIAGLALAVALTAALSDGAGAEPPGGALGDVGSGVPKPSATQVVTPEPTPEAAPVAQPDDRGGGNNGRGRGNGHGRDRDGD
ncbi:MAG: serine/threonine-protein kinase [Candidatus Limnocylindria bacterium]